MLTLRLNIKIKICVNILFLLMYSVPDYPSECHVVYLITVSVMMDAVG